MKRSIFRSAVLFFLLPACAFCATSVVNLSHYDMMRPDFDAIRRQGVVGVIHEATYPSFQRDAKYLDRQMGALRAGLLWGAYHYGNASDPIRQADHFLSVVSNAWAQANPVTRPSAGVLLVLDFEKNGHYPGGSMRPDQAVAFVERIRERTGVYPGVYSGEYHLGQVLNSPRVTSAQKRTLTNCWLWIANYHKEPRGLRIQRGSRILPGRSSTSFAATEAHCKTSGSDAHGTRQVENLAANPNDRSRLSCKF